MTDVLMTLGAIRFSVAEGAYTRLTRTLEIRIARLDRAGATARQVLGHDQTIEIEGVCYPLHRHSPARLDDFRATALTMQPQMLTDGRGFVWGRFLIERVEELATDLDASGVAMRQAFRLSLGAWGEDAAEAAA